VYIFMHLYDCFFEKDCDLIEINPLVLTKDGQIIAADSKVTIDDSASFRQVDIIKHYGGSPANFLDVGGGADDE
jgi:succinyl-CoA synthetase beta subunit